MASRAVVLISGSGTLLQALLDAQRRNKLRVEIVAVGSDRESAHGLVRAERAGIPTFVCPLAGDRALWDAALTAAISQYQPDIVVCAGFMKILGAVFLENFAGRAINSHPSLLPSFPGAHAVRDALDAGVKITGTTIFAIDAGVDTGEILAQEPVRVQPGDTEEMLHERIKQVERRLLVEVINEWK